MGSAHVVCLVGVDHQAQDSCEKRADIGVWDKDLLEWISGINPRVGAKLAYTGLLTHFRDTRVTCQGRS